MNYNILFIVLFSKPSCSSLALMHLNIIVLVNPAANTYFTRYENETGHWYLLLHWPEAHEKKIITLNTSFVTPALWAHVSSIEHESLNSISGSEMYLLWCLQKRKSLLEQSLISRDNATSYHSIMAKHSWVHLYRNDPAKFGTLLWLQKLW